MSRSIELLSLRLCILVSIHIVSYQLENFFLAILPVVTWYISMNVSATLNAFRLIHNPSLCLPHATISTFNHLPIPVSLAFASSLDGQKADIRAVVLDKDDCFARPGENVVYKPYHVGEFLLGIRRLVTSCCTQR